MSGPVVESAWFLLVAGLGTGLCGSIAGLASLVSYPALLASGLPPVVANVTNTVALTASSLGSGLSSVRELSGQGRRLLSVVAATAIGGVLGAALLLLGPASLFEAIVPWLIAAGSILLLARDAVRSWAVRRTQRRGRSAPAWSWHLVMVAVGIYGGYFGAAAGIILLVALSLQRVEPLAVSNAVKNVGLGAANIVAAAIFLVEGSVDLRTAALLGIGVFCGAWIGPRVVRWLPEKPLRIAIGIAGLGLAASLAW